MDLDAGHGLVDRRAAHVLMPDGAGADEHALAVDLLRRHLVVQNVARRDVTLLAMAAVVEVEPPTRVGARLHVAGPDGDDAGPFAERDLAAGAGRFDDIGA